MRYTPRSSVTAAKVLPVASSTAVTTTPGSTPPVESVTVPVNVASWAYATTGGSRIPEERSSRLTILNVMTSPDALTCVWTPSLYTNFVYSSDPPRNLSSFTGRCAVNVRRLAVTAVLACSCIAVLAAQIKTYSPPQTANPGEDWTKRIEGILPPGVESRAEATARLEAYKPDPVKHPVKRTPWDGKPDFSGVYWPDEIVNRPPVPLESLYRPDAREYRERGG